MPYKGTIRISLKNDDRKYKKVSPTLEWLWTTALLFGTVFVLSSFVFADLAEGGFRGTSNGRVVSFLNSLNAMASFRRQRRVLQQGDARNSPNSHKRLSELLYLSGAQHSWSHRIQLFLLMFLAKFGSQSLGSILIGATPVILKGPRHTYSWLLAMACIQLCPRDSVYTKLSDHAALLCIVRIACALYKLRKFNFVSSFALSRSYSLFWMLLVQVIVIDGNNLCSRLSTWGWLRGWRQTSPNDFWIGLSTFCTRAIPLGLASALFYFSSFMNFWLIEFVLKLFVFTLFLYRYDVHILLHKSKHAAASAMPILIDCLTVSPSRDHASFLEKQQQHETPAAYISSSSEKIKNRTSPSEMSHTDHTLPLVPPPLAPGTIPAAACCPEKSKDTKPSQRSARADLRRRLLSPERTNAPPQRSRDTNDLFSLGPFRRAGDSIGDATRRLLRLKRSASWQHLNSLQSEQDRHPNSDESSNPSQATPATAPTTTTEEHHHLKAE